MWWPYFNVCFSVQVMFLELKINKYANDLCVLAWISLKSLHGTNLTGGPYRSLKIKLSLKTNHSHMHTHTSSHIPPPRSLPSWTPTGSVASGREEGDWLLSEGQAAHHRCRGEHEWLCVPQVQGKSHCPAPNATTEISWREQAWPSPNAQILPGTSWSWIRHYRFGSPLNYHRPADL